MGTVILLNLANFAHWIAFPAIAKKAAAYYDVSGFAEWELGIDMICITLPSGEELDLIPTVSYAAGVPTCLIATYLIESRGLKTGVSNYLRSSCNQSHWGATYLQVLRLCDNVLLGEDWSLPDWVWGSPMLSFYIPRHQFNGEIFVWADTLISCIFALQVPKYQQYWMAVVGQVGQEYSSRCQPSASCNFSSQCFWSSAVIVITFLVLPIPRDWPGSPVPSSQECQRKSPNTGTSMSWSIIIVIVIIIFDSNIIIIIMISIIVITIIISIISVVTGIIVIIYMITQKCFSATVLFYTKNLPNAPIMLSSLWSSS